MATGATMTKNVKDIILDSSFSDDRILELLIEGHNDINRYCSLPDLISSEDVLTVTDNHVVALPGTYSHGLFDCTDETPTNLINVVDSESQLRKKYGHLQHSGLVYDVCARGSTFLVYQPIPSTARTLTLHFYRKPTDITTSTEPEGIPAHLHKHLEHYALWMLWNIKEDDVEGRAPNTDKYEKLYLIGREAIKDATAQGRAHVGPIIIAGEYL